MQHICHELCGHNNLREATDPYWLSNAGLQRRIQMLVEGMSYRIVNNALQFYGENNDVAGYLGIPGATNHCTYCLQYVIGRYYRRGQFMPGLPAHANCSCFFQLVPKKEQE